MPAVNLGLPSAPETLAPRRKSRQIKVGKELTLPHPRASERAFVLVPWSLLEPDAVLPGYGSVKELAEPIKDQVWLVR